MKTVPKEYLVKGMEASSYSKLNEGAEAVKYTTPNGTNFTLAKDFMGIQYGRKIQLREDWKKEEIKRVVMYTGLTMKFMGNYNIASKLMATNNKELIEGNWWHDNYWGDCKCDKCRHIVGENNLGKLLMLTRDMLTLIRI